jgi:hypothetical protein
LGDFVNEGEDVSSLSWLFLCRLHCLLGCTVAGEVVEIVEELQGLLLLGRRLRHL